MTTQAHIAHRWLAHVAAPLGLGGALYVVARPRGLLFWEWAEALGLGSPLTTLRALANPAACALPEWVRYTLPDALWVYALTAAIVLLHRESSRWTRALYLLVPLALGPGAELLQLAHLLPGTFDALDLVATVAAFGLASYRALMPTAPEALPRGA